MTKETDLEFLRRAVERGARVPDYVTLRAIRMSTPI